MVRLACVELPALPLQVLRRREPSWASHPMAVVDEDRPTGEVLWVNQAAWGAGIRPGMRYAAALSLAGGLRAAVVDEEALGEARAELVQTLQLFSPRVEQTGDAGGGFWIDASGLDRLYTSMESWADAVHDAVYDLGYRCTIVVGFRKHAVYALARARHRRRVLETQEQEQQQWLRVPLDRLGLPPKLMRFLQRMGQRTLGDLIALPEAELRQRFGQAATVWHQRMNSSADENLSPMREVEICEISVDWDHAERNKQRLMHVVRRRLPEMIGTLLAADAQLSSLTIELRLERGGLVTESIRAARPTLDEGLWLELVQLKLDATPFAEGIVGIRLVAHAQRAQHQQGMLLSTHPKRDLAAANRALARLRAELGEQAIGTLCVGDGHLPEARVAWSALENLKAARPERRQLRPLVRRLHRPALPLPPRQRHEPDGWLVRGLEPGPVVRTSGPHIIDGGWWATEIAREYHYLETSRGHLYWAFYDRRRRRWFLQGEVE
ncbi:MAG: protein ImuB [Bradymonadia bacterium]|jgi:protein ImuB